MYSLADRLGKTATEVLAMPEAELQGWVAYISHVNRVQKAAGLTKSPK